MATDVKLDQVDGSYLVLEGRVVKSEASDFMIDAADRRKGGGPFRRAFVHDQSDGLTINFASDYPGGITLNGVAAITPKTAPGFHLLPVLPTLVVHGDISYEVETVQLIGSGVGRATVSLSGEISKLLSQISELTARVAALEKK